MESSVSPKLWHPGWTFSERMLALSLPVLAGVLWAAVICVGAGWEGTPGLLIIAVAGALGVVPVVFWFPGFAPYTLLILLATTLSVSIKKHIWPVAGHLGGSIGVRISITEVLIVCLLATLCGALFSGRRIRLVHDRTIDIAFGIYLLFATCSMFAASDPKMAFFQWIAVIQSFAVFLFLLNYLNSVTRLKVFAAGLLIGLALQSSVAIVQDRKPGVPNLSALGAAEEGEDTIENGRVALPDVDTGTTFVAGEVTHRPSGLLIHPNVLALYLVLTIPVAMAVWLSFSETWLQLLGAASMCLGFGALYLTLSRSGWMALGAGLAVAALLVWRWGLLRITRFKRAIVAVALVGLVVAVAMKADRVLARMTDTADEAIEFRRDLTVMAVRMIVDHPLLGVGLNSFVTVAAFYDATGMTRLKTYPVHNTFLLEMSETGLPGGIAFIVMIYILGARGFQAARSCRTPAAHALALLTACGFVGFWIGDMSNFVYRVPIMTSLIWAHVALVLATARVCGNASLPQAGV